MDNTLTMRVAILKSLPVHSQVICKIFYPFAQGSFWPPYQASLWELLSKNKYPY